MGKGTVVMEPVIQQFRSALGGFNRRDVQRYIESSSAAHRKEVAELQARLEAALHRQRELEAALSDLEGARSAAAAEEAKVREHLETSTQTLTRLRGEQTETESRLAVARQELERLQAQVAQLAPMADNYNQLKDRVATVELDAHRKAQGIVDEASGQAEDIRNDTRRWLNGVLAQYGAVRQGVDALLAQAKALTTVGEQTAALEAEAGKLKERGGID